MIPSQWKGKIYISGIAQVLLVTTLLLMSCGSLSDQSSSSGSMFTVASINGTYIDGLITNQVDIEQVNCTTDPEKEPELEYYSDHFAEVGFVNRPLPNHADQTASAVYLKQYSIRYLPNTVLTANYPLPTQHITNVLQEVWIPPCLPETPCSPTVISGLDFVSIDLKSLLRSFFIEAGNQLSYNAVYAFELENDFGEKISVTGQLYFYVANYDYCG